MIGVPDEGLRENGEFLFSIKYPFHKMERVTGVDGDHPLLCTHTSPFTSYLGLISAPELKQLPHSLSRLRVTPLFGSLDYFPGGHYWALRELPVLCCHN